jgi:hypothetical protein
MVRHQTVAHHLQTANLGQINVAKSWHPAGLPVGAKVWQRDSTPKMVWLGGFL